MKRDDLDLSPPRQKLHNLEAEQALIGSVLADNGAMDRVSDAVGAADFYGANHRAIWSAIVGILAAGKPADPVTVAAALGDRAEDVGGIDYLQALSVSVPSAAHARRYAELVRERAMHRRLIAAVDEAAELAQQPDCSPAEKLDRIGALFDRLERAGQRSAPRRMDTLVGEALGRYTEAAEGRREMGLRTRFARLDSLLGGLRGGKLYGIAARPSVGKSSTARSIGIRVAQDGHPVLILSQEMPQDEQTDCVLAELASVDSQRVQAGRMSHDEWSRLADAADVAAGLPLYVDEQGSLTLADIRTKARGVKGMKLLIVDYLQLCASTLKGKSTNDEIAELSKGLKALALEMRIPIVVLSQLSREVERRADKEPQLSDLRDSGAIEQDLDVAVMLWTIEESEPTRLVGCKVAKNRGGRKGRFALHFTPAVYRWEDAGDIPERAPRKGGDL